ncbi:hypothetical protein ACHAW5_001641 [Stephanodiscus triporus]|uniref:Ribosome biogenesis protein WDR12 homolog n=1 Tax=Stephanodiscus triporus TaxID=2934178 RepID=A0ABD3Q0G7_9STRA
MDYHRGGGGVVVDDGTLFAGGADGVVRAFAPSSSDGGPRRACSASASAHAGAIQCLAASAASPVGGGGEDDGGGAMVATGSMDQTLVTHVLLRRRGAGDGEEEDGATATTTTTMGLHAVYSGGHANSVSSVAFSGDGRTMASGDWDGGLSLWSVPSASPSNLAEEDDVVDDDVNPKKKKKKKRRGGVDGAAAARDDGDGDGIREVKPLASVRAHSSNVSGLAWGHDSPTTLITGSWDHGLRVYDTNRMDCVLTLNGSRVVSALGRCSNSNVVATGSPDCTVRLWDMRTNGGGGGSNGGMDKSLRQSHKAWVSSVRWSPTDPFVLASTSHDGTLKVWDIRSYLPLHTVNAVNSKKSGEKALCLAFGDGVIFTGGSDCVVKQFSCNI